MKWCKLARDVKSKRCKTRAGCTVKFLPMCAHRGVEVQLHSFITWASELFWTSGEKISYPEQESKDDYLAFHPVVTTPTEPSRQQTFCKETNQSKMSSEEVNVSCKNCRVKKRSSLCYTLM